LGYNLFVAVALVRIVAKEANVVNGYCEIVTDGNT